tara:strand:+ start:1037 stop:1534 length:498 start_codon:yes stop_codon:yes gene_type:complete
MNSIHVVLCSPRIPQNTGNIIRLCANTGAELHLVHPLGFDMGSANLKRAALDYTDLTTICEHASFDEYKKQFSNRRLLATTSSGNTLYSSIEYTTNDSIIFGSEDTGLSAEIVSLFKEDALIKIPMQPSNRSLNLSNAVAIVMYEAWRQSNFIGTDSNDITKHFS